MSSPYRSHGGSSREIMPPPPTPPQPQDSFPPPYRHRKNIGYGMATRSNIPRYDRMVHENINPFQAHQDSSNPHDHPSHIGYGIATGSNNQVHDRMIHENANPFQAHQDSSDPRDHPRHIGYGIATGSNNQMYSRIVHENANSYQAREDAEDDAYAGYSFSPCHDSRISQNSRSDIRCQPYESGNLNTNARHPAPSSPYNDYRINQNSNSDIRQQSYERANINTNTRNPVPSSPYHDSRINQNSHFDIRCQAYEGANPNTNARYLASPSSYHDSRVNQNSRSDIRCQSYESRNLNTNTQHPASPRPSQEHRSHGNSNASNNESHESRSINVDTSNTAQSSSHGADRPSEDSPAATAAIENIYLTMPASWARPIPRESNGDASERARNSEPRMSRIENDNEHQSFPTLPKNDDLIFTRRGLTSDKRGDLLQVLDQLHNLVIETKEVVEKEVKKEVKKKKSINFKSLLASNELKTAKILEKLGEEMKSLVIRQGSEGLSHGIEGHRVVAAWIPISIVLTELALLLRMSGDQLDGYVTFSKKVRKEVATKISKLRPSMLAVTNLLIGNPLKKNRLDNPVLGENQFQKVQQTVTMFQRAETAWKNEFKKTKDELEKTKNEFKETEHVE